MYTENQFDIKNVIIGEKT